MSEHDTLTPAEMPVDEASPAAPTLEERARQAEASAQAAWRAVGTLEQVAHGIARQAQNASAAAEEASAAAQACTRAIDELRLSGTRPRMQSVTSEVRRAADAAVASIRAEASELVAFAPQLPHLAQHVELLAHAQPAARRENRLITIGAAIFIATVQVIATAYFASLTHH
ncbi:MAG TPA: hypothetical protein VGI39_03200 [Polyangiaceae bacterium]